MMTRQDRAKQFMPFDAMKGLSEALRDREERHLREERRELGEEAQARLNESLCRLERGNRVRIRCYLAFHEEEREGTVTAINCAYKYLKLDDYRIGFEDIYDLTLLDLN